MVSSPQAAARVDPVDDALLEFRSGYWSRRTRGNYAFILRGWFTWCAKHEHDPMRDIGPRVIEAWIADLQERGYAANTIAGRVSAVSAFDRWCVREQRSQPHRCRTSTPTAQRIDYGEPDTP